MTGQITLLDGGMGQELQHRSKMPPSPLWSTQVLMDEPEIVSAVHRAYIDAGAEIITLASYSSTRQRMGRLDAADQFEAVQAAGVRIAGQARAGAGRPDVRIGGCLPPLAGSYRPDITPPDDVCRTEYRAIVEAQQDGVDLFLCETMCCIRELRAAVGEAVKSGKPVWCGVTVDDEDGTVLRSGEPVGDAARAAMDEGAAALLINCSFPEAVTQALAALPDLAIAVGGYANGFTTIKTLVPGETVAPLRARTDLGPEAYAAHAEQWISEGATIVGGCCEVGPAHIAHLAAILGKD